jgi:hypothetical protein
MWCLIGAGCGLFDLLRPSDLAEVVLSYQGDSVVRTGGQLPFAVTVSIGATPLENPRLIHHMSDTTIARLAPGGGEIVGVRVGRCTLQTRLAGSIFTDSAPALATAIRVIGGPGGP